MSFNIFLFILTLSMTLMMLFYLSSKKNKWEKWNFSSFESGFTSYFFSRFSFSIHYFMVALIFLFLDLEICVIMPLFTEDMMDMSSLLVTFFVLMILFVGLVEEWKMNKLEWAF